MSMDILGVIKLEHDALERETRIAQCPPLVAVNDMDDVARVPTVLRWNRPTSVNAVSGAKGPAFVVSCPALQSSAMWVGTDNDRYRDDYVCYLNEVHGLGLTRIPAEYDVDHLYNRSRAKQYGLKFIRTALVTGAANRSHGGAYEKDVTINEAMRTRTDMKLMDEITSMKYFGFLSPLRNDPRDKEVDTYADFAAARLGLDPKQVRKTVLSLRQKASTPWARKP
jgi:hypothetical protein